MAVPTLAYWDIRGLGTPIRFLLEYAGVKYDEKLYKCGPPPEFNRGQWLDEKFNIGLDFPNLPYYMDEEVKLTQSGPILRHLARKHGLDGKNEKDKARADLLSAQVYDFHMEYARIVYNPQFLELKDDYEKTLPNKLKALSDFLGDNKFVVGDYVTFADFHLFEFLEGQQYFKKDLLKDCPNLEQFHQRIASLEPIAAYMKSSRFIKYPFNGAPAYFGGKFSDELAKTVQK